MVLGEFNGKKIKLMRKKKSITTSAFARRVDDLRSFSSIRWHSHTALMLKYGRRDSSFQ